MSNIQQLIYDVARILLWPVLVAAVLCLIWVLIELGVLLYELWLRFRYRDLDALEVRALRARKAFRDGKPRTAYRYLQENTYSLVVVRFLYDLIRNYQTERLAAKPLKLLQEYEFYTIKRLERTRILVRIGPMLGLMGTLIPLAPALVGLASGNVQQLSDNLVTAFSVTVIGLLIGGLAFLVSIVRDRIYSQDISDMEYLLELLEGSDVRLRSGRRLSKTRRLGQRGPDRVRGRRRRRRTHHARAARDPGRAAAAGGRQRRRARPRRRANRPRGRARQPRPPRRPSNPAARATASPSTTRAWTGAATTTRSRVSAPSTPRARTIPSPAGPAGLSAVAERPCRRTTTTPGSRTSAPSWARPTAGCATCAAAGSAPPTATATRSTASSTSSTWPSCSPSGSWSRRWPRQGVTGLLTSKNMTIVTNPGTPEMQVIVKEGDKITKLDMQSGAQVAGVGTLIGSFYKLADGTVIYVPAGQAAPERRHTGTRDDADAGCDHGAGHHSDAGRDAHAGGDAVPDRAAPPTFPTPTPGVTLAPD